MPSTDIDGTPILIFSVDEIIQLEEILIESNLVKLNDPLFIKVVRFKQDVVEMAERTCAENPEARKKSISRSEYWKNLLAGDRGRDSNLSSKTQSNQRQKPETD